MTILTIKLEESYAILVIEGWGSSEIINYISKEAPKVFSDKISPGYIKRFFYSQAGNYKDMAEYSSQKYLYDLSHAIIAKVA